MKNNKNLIIIIGILLICGITIFKYINNKNSQIDTGTTETTPESVLLDTSGWETCRNEEYGYEFKYRNKGKTSKQFIKSYPKAKLEIVTQENYLDFIV